MVGSALSIDIEPEETLGKDIEAEECETLELIEQYKSLI